MSAVEPCKAVILSYDFQMKTGTCYFNLLNRKNYGTYTAL